MSVVKGHANDHLTADGRSKSAKRNVGLQETYAAVLNGKTKVRELWNVKGPNAKGPSGTKNATRSY